MALTYDRNRAFPVDPRLNAVKFTKRKPGRPKKLGLALTREAPLVPEDGDQLDEADGGDELVAVARGRGALPGPSRGRGQLRVRGVRNRGQGRGAGQPQAREEETEPVGLARGSLTLPGPSRGRGQLRVRGVRVRGGQRSLVVPSNLWSSSMFLGNIEVSDVGESHGEEDEGESSQDDRATSSQDEQAEDHSLELDL